jgi:ATP-dependent DNA helicase RecG
MDLRDLKGLGKARILALEKAGIGTIDRLINTFPVSYRDTTSLVPIGELVEGQCACVGGYLKSKPRLTRFHGMTCVCAALADGTGSIGLVWFNQPWMAKLKDEESGLLIYGQAESKNGKLRMNSPAVVRERCLIPVYRHLPGIPLKVLSGCIRQALEQTQPCRAETLPAGLIARHNLCQRDFALRQIHFPENAQSLALSRRRLSFEHLLLYQAALSLLRSVKEQGVKIAAAEGSLDTYWRSLPFTPTSAQVRALSAIAADMARDIPMRRLVQGDVGSGKTAIALGAVIIACGAGYQTAFMAPTEILARQHLETARVLLTSRGIRCGFLTGGMPAKERKDALANIADGSWQTIIGTHALLSQDVAYKNLGLVITDEQHRFGVRQRRLLADKAADGLQPHVLVMSATPIPRTLALILYGDLDLSVIDELPPGRKPVNTRIIPEIKREGMYRFVVEQARRGQQAYIVCPLVTENEENDLYSAKELYAELTNGPLSSVKTGLTYGSQNSREKEKTLGAFSRGEFDVLVSTTVIEVGVNVPNATVMIIENADRFGLSQLHQLRGRVGRGGDQSWCFLLGTPNERLNTLCQTNDGFKIAQKDLELRGPGEFLGTRQHGTGFSGIPGGAPDAQLAEETRDCIRLLEQDARLADEYGQVIAAAKVRFDDLLANTAFS